MKGAAVHGLRIPNSARKSCRQGKRAIVNSAVRDGDGEICTQRDRWSNGKLQTPRGGSVSVFVISVDAVSDIESSYSEAITCAASNSTRSANSFTKQRETAAIKTKFEMRFADAGLRHQVDDTANRVCPVNRRTGAT